MPPKPPPLWGSTRLTLVILSFLGAVIMMVLRFNFSMAIVCMTSDSSVSNATSTAGAEFQWEKSTQGYLLSAFFYGYICTLSLIHI